MTWFANEILARAVPGLLREVTEFVGYREAVHVIRSLESHGFHDEAVRHGLPSEGLLVVRPIGEPADLEGWYDEPVVPWLSPPNWEPGKLCIAPSALSKFAGGIGNLPPDTFLRALSGLAARHQTTVAYGYFSMWGGTNELEYAWIFDEEETVLVNSRPENVHVRLRDGSPACEENEDLVMALCSYLGMPLPTPYFAPHTRSFSWTDHRIVPAGLHEK